MFEAAARGMQQFRFRATTTVPTPRALLPVRFVSLANPTVWLSPVANDDHMAEETTPALRYGGPRSSDASVRYQNTGATKLPAMLGVRSAPGYTAVQSQSIDDTERKGVFRPVFKRTADPGWTHEMRLHCVMFTIVAFLLVLLVAAMAVLIYALFADSGTWTKIARMTDTGDYMIQRLNDSQIVESVFFAAETWQNGNYTEVMAVALTSTQGNVMRLMNTLDTMDWNQFKVAANATLVEVLALIQLFDGFIKNGFQITIPLAP